VQADSLERLYRCLRHEPLRTLEQHIAYCLAITSERRLRFLTLKRPFREAACSVCRKAVGFRGRMRTARVESRRTAAASNSRMHTACVLMPGASVHSVPLNRLARCNLHGRADTG
jgi:hypothetical protein